MKILLDECVDRRLSLELIGHEVITVPQRGWAVVKNGDLLALAEKEFEAFITVELLQKLAAAPVAAFHLHRSLAEDFN